MAAGNATGNAAAGSDTGGVVIDGIGDTIANGVKEFLQYLLDFLQNSNASVGIGQEWFTGHFDMMAAMGLWVMAPLIVLSIIQAVAKSSMEQAIKSVLVYPVIAILGTVVALTIVQLLVLITDDLSSLFNASAQGQMDQFFNAVISGFDVSGQYTTTDESAGDLEGAGRTLFIILIGLGIILASLMTIVILAIRDASIYIATLFLPIGFAMMVWPATAKWFRRVAELLLAVILSKLVIVATIALAVSAAVAAAGPIGGIATVGVDGTTVGPTVAQAGMTEGDATFQWLYLSLFALVVLLFAVYSPNATSRMISLALGEAAGAFDANMGRPMLARWATFTNRWAYTIPGTIRSTKAHKEAYSAEKQHMRDRTLANERLENLGYGGAYIDDRGREKYDYRLTADELRVVNGAARFYDPTTGTWTTISDTALRTQLENWSRDSTNANNVAMAHEILNAYKTGGTVEFNMNEGWVSSQRNVWDKQSRSYVAETDTTIVAPLSTPTGAPINDINGQDLRDTINRVNNHYGTPGSASQQNVRVRTGLNNPQVGVKKHHEHIQKKVDAVVNDMQAGAHERRRYVHDLGGPRVR